MNNHRLTKYIMKYECNTISKYQYGIKITDTNKHVNLALYIYNASSKKLMKHIQVTCN